MPPSGLAIIIGAGPNTVSPLLATGFGAQQLSLLELWMSYLEINLKMLFDLKSRCLRMALRVILCKNFTFPLGDDSRGLQS